MLGVAFLSVAVLAQRAGPSAAVVRSTSAKSLQEFAACFAASQERDSRPWSFIPDGRGGSFMARMYRMTVTERPRGLGIRLMASGPDEAATVISAVKECR